MRTALRKIIGVLLLACLLAPGAQAQAYAQTDKLSLEALTAPAPPGSGGGYAPARRRAARAYHLRTYRYGTPRTYRRQVRQYRAYRHRTSPAYRRYAPRHYGYAVHRPYGHGRFRFHNAPQPGAYHAARRATAFAPHHARRARHDRH